MEVSEEQVLYFRTRRSHLVGTGAGDATAAARAILGGQAQQPGPGMLAVSQRTRNRPTAESLKAQMLGEPPRTLVRTWGQRETLHIYDPADWALIAAARRVWAPAGRRGPMPTAKVLDKALRKIEKTGTATRTDLLGLSPKSYEDTLLREHGNYLKSREEARRFAAGRLVWCLSMRGDVCIAHKVGTEQAYAARSIWCPELPDPPDDAAAAATELTRRYFRFNGPATAQDVAHYFGARVKEAKEWITALGDELVAVGCGERKGLLLLSDDIRALNAKAPDTDWPLRLLPQWDTYLMGHADKSWTVPDAGDRKRVWRGQAVVAAAVLHRGRVVAEWNHAVKRGKLEVTVIPLSRWKAKHLSGVKRELKVVAAHLGAKQGAVSV